MSRGAGQRRPHVAFIGGLDRLESELVAAGEDLGVDVEVHDGKMSSARLVAIVHRSDVVVLVTGVNSHGAVRLAKREADRVSVPVKIVKYCGRTTARAILGEIARQAA